MRFHQRKIYLLALVHYLFLVQFCWANSNWQETLAQAESAYKNGKAEEALQLYQKILDGNNWQNEIRPGAIYYNAGTAAMKAGKLGWAYGYFIKAKNFEPLDSDISYNLNFLQQKLGNLTNRGSISYIPKPLEFLFYTPADMHLLAALICLSLVFLLKFRRTLLSLAILLFILYGARISLDHVKNAVVISDESVVRSGPGESFPEILRISQASHLQVNEAQNDWLKVSFVLGNSGNKNVVGWINSTSVLKLRE